MSYGRLWLPIVVSALVVWIASAIAHMALRHHRADYKGLPDEEAVGAAMRKAAVPPGYYVIPYCPDPSKMQDAKIVERYASGPVAMIAVLKSAPPALGKHLVQWLLFCILVGFVSAYLARQTLTPGAAGMTVCRITGTVAFAGYGLGYLQDSIWKGMPWSNSLRGMLDAAVYALLTGIVFSLLWPGA
jgi:hypothetical protein